jgi:hypothetical protein
MIGTTLSRTVIFTLLSTTVTFAHCDSLDGPVVNAARKALNTSNVDVVLPWVQPDAEPVIRQAFARTLAVRRLNPDAKALADTWFFETLVRIHRAGEGAPYTGLKPAGDKLDPSIGLADKALETGRGDQLIENLTAKAKVGLQHRFQRVIEAGGYKPSDVKAGRQYVAAYVDFIHFAERLGTVVASAPEGASGHEHEH